MQNLIKSAERLKMGKVQPKRERKKRRLLKEKLKKGHHHQNGLHGHQENKTHYFYSMSVKDNAVFVLLFL